LAFNSSYDKPKCDKEYSTARDLIGTLVIRQGSTIIDSSNFIFVSETGSKSSGYTGTFVDSVILNNTGTYTATATFYEVTDPAKQKSVATLSFTVGVGSAIPLSAGTYKLSSFTAMCVNSVAKYTYNNVLDTNKVILNADGVTASMSMDINIAPSTLALYPCLDTTSYSYSASGNYSVFISQGNEYFKIEYQNSAFVNFNFTFDGTNLTLNYSKNGSDFELKFIKQ
jgi:hypothetical protein